MRDGEQRKGKKFLYCIKECHDLIGKEGGGRVSDERESPAERKGGKGEDNFLWWTGRYLTPLLGEWRGGTCKYLLLRGKG